MVRRKIPKDHRGLYLSDPFLHGKQSQITETCDTESRRAALCGEKVPGRQGEGSSPSHVIIPAAAYKASGILDNMKTKEKRLEDALHLFQYGYENTVVAARCEITVEEVKELRRKHEK